VSVLFGQIDERSIDDTALFGYDSLRTEHGGKLLEQTFAQPFFRQNLLMK
jgi:hypothetical protein